MRPVRSAFAAVAAAALLWTAQACSDDPFAITWRAFRDTVLVYSVDRPELNLPSAFNFHPTGRFLVQIESPGATGNWDLAVGTGDGGLVFLPPGELGIESTAAVARFPGLTIDELEEAPSDSSVYSRRDPVAAETGSAYVVRTRETRDGFGRICVFYAVMEPVEVDLGAEIVRFVYDVSPKCNDRSLLPDIPLP